MADRKTALVTGASNGMGLEIALALAKRDIFVVMLCRNLHRGEAALKYIKEKGGGRNAAIMLCDLGDMAHIRSFCTQFKKNYPSIDILVNNAGVLNMDRRETKDGLEEHFGVCHIGHFLLTRLLLDFMSKNARIVVMSSVAHKAGKIDFDDLGMKKRYSVTKAYSRAKLCNMLFTMELARRLKDKDITVNCVHPGAVVTNIGAKRKEGKTGLGFMRKAAGRLFSPFVKTAEQGAATAVYVATSDDCAKVSGAYFVNCKKARASRKSADEALAKRLWAVSEQLCGIEP